MCKNMTPCVFLLVFHVKLSIIISVQKHYTNCLKNFQKLSEVEPLNSVCYYTMRKQKKRAKSDICSQPIYLFHALLLCFASVSETYRYMGFFFGFFATAPLSHTQYMKYVLKCFPLVY